MNIKHGMGHTAEYRIWSGMKNRCYNQKEKCYPRYGGRGITVCDRWLDSFPLFFADMGKRPNGMLLERIDNNRGYSPDNCKWASFSDQMHNRRGFGNTGILGVHKIKSGYQALITKNYQRHYLGTFRTSEEAKAAYDRKARELYA